jgi:hypothetical protein
MLHLHYVLRGMVSCLGNNSCPKRKLICHEFPLYSLFVFVVILNIAFLPFLAILDRYSLRINCGGKLITYNESLTYDDDSNEIGPASFRRTASNWALSNTGHFFDRNNSLVDYSTWSNKTNLSMKNAELYMNARVSPLSLTYYGFCMGNGNYTVNLHFAEIMFTDDQTYSSLGRRIFDIYIQVHDLIILFSNEQNAFDHFEPLCFD